MEVDSQPTTIDPKESSERHSSSNQPSDASEKIVVNGHTESTMEKSPSNSTDSATESIGAAEQPTEDQLKEAAAKLAAEKEEVIFD